MNYLKTNKMKLIVVLIALFTLFQVYKFIKVRISNMDLPKGKIVFSSDADGDIEIYTTNINGTNFKQLTKNSATNIDSASDDDPSFSPDGEKIVFTSSRQGQDTEFIYDYRGRIIGSGSSKTGTSDIYIMDSDGSNQMPLTYQGLDSNPFFTPDGKRIVFESNKPASIRMLDISNSNQTVLNFGGGQVRFSPDGKKIFDNFQHDLSVADIGGTNRIKLTHFSDSTEVKRDKKNQVGIVFNLSPNGKKIVFIIDETWSVDSGGPINNYYNLFRIYNLNTDGSDLKEIYTFRPKTLGSISKFRYSPDGNNIIFIENHGTCGIYSLNLLRKFVVNLIGEKENWEEILDFTFSPNGKRIIFVANIYPKNYYFHAVILRNIRAYINYYLFRKSTPFYDNKYLCIMDIDGKNYRRIARLPQGTELGRDFIHWEE